MIFRWTKEQFSGENRMIRNWQFTYEAKEVYSIRVLCLRAYLNGEKLSLVGGFPSPPSHHLSSVYMKKVVPVY